MKITDFPYHLREKRIFRYLDDTFINWHKVPGFFYLGIENLEEAKITARTNPHYLTRRKGVVPEDIQRLINSPFDKII